MSNILILGHTGMLGNALCKYLQQCNVGYATVKDGDRFSSEEYLFEIKSFDFTDFYIVNCAGSIPQRTKSFSINYTLPEFLCDKVKSAKLIQISTDCVYNAQAGYPYSSDSLLDATSDYGKSKIRGDMSFLNADDNFKILRTSIIGIDKNNAGLLSWFLALPQNSTVNGYAGELWQGVTTLTLSKYILDLIFNWDKFNKLTLISSKHIYSKYDLLKEFTRIFNRKDINIVYDCKIRNNRSLYGDIVTDNISDQLIQLKKFYHATT